MLCFFVFVFCGLVAGLTSLNGCDSAAGKPVCFHKEYDPGGTFGEYPSFRTLTTPGPGAYPGARNEHLMVPMGGSPDGFFIFGGKGFTQATPNQRLNDLWEYHIDATNGDQIKWSSGSAGGGTFGVYNSNIHDAVNMPGGRSHACGFSAPEGTSDSEFFMFGGEGISNDTYREFLGDFWSFRTSDSTWRYISGDYGVGSDLMSNYENVVPVGGVVGPRRSCAGFSFEGSASLRFFLFGGSGDLGFSTAHLNDLWEWNVAYDRWDYLGGGGDHEIVPKRSGYPIITLSPDEFESTHWPGGRSETIYWSTPTSLWIFGGWGLGVWPNDGSLCDLWEYSISLGWWRHPYGTLYTTFSGRTKLDTDANEVSCRWGGAGFHHDGYSYLFGGHGYDREGDIGPLADFWRFQHSNDSMQWFPAFKFLDPALRKHGYQDVTLRLKTGRYTATSDPSEILYPAGRSYVSGCATKDHFVLFGGTGSIPLGEYQDMWTVSLPHRCFGKDGMEPLVCNGHGTCSSPETCTCDTGYDGIECAVLLSCFGKDATDALVCDGHGKCTTPGPGTCRCDSGFSGEECSSTSSSSSSALTAVAIVVPLVVVVILVIVVVVIIAGVVVCSKMKRVKMKTNIVPGSELKPVVVEPSSQVVSQGKDQPLDVLQPVAVYSQPPQPMAGVSGGSGHSDVRGPRGMEPMSYVAAPRPDPKAAPSVPMQPLQADVSGVDDVY